MTFDELGLSARMVKRFGAPGLTGPAPFQEQATPPALQGRDILGIGEVGTVQTAPTAGRPDRMVA